MWCTRQGSTVAKRRAGESKSTFPKARDRRCERRCSSEIGKIPRGCRRALHFLDLSILSDHHLVLRLTVFSRPGLSRESCVAKYIRLPCSTSRRSQWIITVRSNQDLAKDTLSEFCSFPLNLQRKRAIVRYQLHPMMVGQPSRSPFDADRTAFYIFSLLHRGVHYHF